MKSFRSDGVDLAYRVEGRGPETVVLSHSYTVDHHHFDDLIEALACRFRVVAYDHRDHGASGRLAAAYGFDEIVADAVRVIDHLDAAPCHFVGLSTGGFVGLRLALDHPELLRRLVLMDTSAGPEPAPARRKYKAMFAVLRLFGTRPLMPFVMATMFGRSFLGDPARREEVALWRKRIAAADPGATIRFGNAIFARDDVRDRLHEIRTPTLIVAGAEDRAQPPALSLRMADAIPGARLSVIPGAGHLVTVEQPQAVRDLVLPFLGGDSGSSPRSRS